MLAQSGETTYDLPPSPAPADSVESVESVSKAVAQPAANQAVPTPAPQPSAQSAAELQHAPVKVVDLAEDSLRVELQKLKDENARLKQQLSSVTSRSTSSSNGTVAAAAAGAVEEALPPQGRSKARLPASTAALLQQKRELTEQMAAAEVQL